MTAFDSEDSPPHHTVELATIFVGGAQRGQEEGVALLDGLR